MKEIANQALNKFIETCDRETTTRYDFFHAGYDAGRATLLTENAELKAKLEEAEKRVTGLKVCPGCREVAQLNRFGQCPNCEQDEIEEDAIHDDEEED